MVQTCESTPASRTAGPSDESRYARSMPRRPCAAAPVRIALIGLATTLIAVAVPPVAAADVLIESVLRPDATSASPTPREVSRTLFSPGQPARTLASRTGSLGARHVPGAVSPDRRSIALATGSGIEIIPIDGSPSVVLRRRGNDATVAGLSAVWWSADGRRVSISQSRRQGGRSSVLRCVVDTAHCQSRSVGHRQVMGVLADERLVTTQPTPRKLLRALNRYTGRWRSTTAREVARDRRTLATTERQSIDVLDPDGRVRTLWDARRSVATGRWTYVVASQPQAGEVLVPATRIGAVIRTRTFRGRLQARLEDRENGARLWRIDAAGRRLTTQPYRSRDRSFDRIFAGYVRVPGVGWLPRISVITPDTPASLLRPNGQLRPLTIGDQPLTVPRLETHLLGRAPSLGALADVYEIAGFEPATDSAIVHYEGDGDRMTVVRLPLAGTAPPSTVYRGAANKLLWAVHAW